MPHRRPICLLASSTFLAAAAALPVQAQAPAASTHGLKTAAAVRVSAPPVVDGLLGDEAWAQAKPSEGFRQRDPQEGAPATERTEFRVLYTTDTLYIGIECFDSNPAGIVAGERRRDNDLVNDDTVSVVLDTFHDHRNSYLFRTNPLGAQYDAQVTDEGKDVNVNWDEKWDAASRTTDAGWSTEIAIPFKSLRVPDNQGESWGLDVERVIRRKNEQTYWNSYRRGFTLQSASQWGHLTGLQGFDTGMRLRVKPYVVGGFTQQSSRVLADRDNASDIGMEVLKYRVTPGLTLDVTANTDFAQTEVDAQTVNLDRFPLFFPEKREFFLEGAGIYEFGQARSEGTIDAKLFHSRRIGLSDTREPIPIRAGARLSGNAGGFAVGLMNVQTGEARLGARQVRGSNYSVVRLKRNVLGRSSIGGFVLNREIMDGGDFNRVYGGDANLVFYRYLTINGLWAKSDQPGNAANDWMSAGSITWDSDLLLAGVETVAVEPDFRDDLGYVPRRDMRRITPVIGISPRPRSGPIRQISFQPRFDTVWNREWVVESRRDHYNLNIDFQSGDSIVFAPHHRVEKLDEPFVFRDRLVNLGPGINVRQPVVVVPAGEYAWWYPRMTYNLNPARRLSGNVVFQAEPGFFGGDLYEWIFSPRLKVTDTLSLDLSYSINDGHFGDVEFLDHIVNMRVNYSMNNQWLTTTTVQYNNVDAFAGVNFRLDYIFRPGDDFFLIYNEGRALNDTLDGQRDRSLVAKLTYSLDF
ncbi:MAG: carbohydrate binding family 9 domain-containing protein [Acidobacteria bacterium]|nr:carbohydrate binding family 9 domain-containing protein [Acidobacteriota bacterium]